MSPSAEPKVPVAGSERRPMPGARDLGPAIPNSRVEVTLWIRRGSPPGEFPSLEELGHRPVGERRYLARDEFARRHGARPDDLDRVRSFAARAGLEVRDVVPARRTVVLAGPVSAMETAFGIRLRRFAHAAGSYRGHTGPVTFPSELDGVVEAVLGLDDRPQAKPHFRRASGPAPAAYTPLDLGGAYSFPPGASGEGECIGLLEFGGGYSTADLTEFFSGLGVPAPSVTAVSVDGAANAPTGSADGPDGEVELDVEVAGALAPGARLVVYFAPNTDKGFLDALTSAVQDTVHRPTVISVSWGGPEPSWSDQARAALNSAAEDAASLGITVVAASGDDGASDGAPAGTLAVDFPASSPYVLGCGGTEVTIADGRIASEVTWDDLPTGGGASGGGVSVDFPRPTFQASADVPAAPNGFAGRGVPDVAGDADPSTGYGVVVDGQALVLGGTSAVAPLWAALLARINQSLGRAVGYVTPLLYAPTVRATFHDITVGANGGYSAGPGWDPCTGLGSPDGAALLAALGGGPTPSAVASASRANGPSTGTDGEPRERRPPSGGARPASDHAPP
jgi:kumamolisin